MKEKRKWPDKSYLGDGAYVQLGSYLGEVVVTTENGISVQNTVVLGVREIRALIRYLKRHDFLEIEEDDR